MMVLSSTHRRHSSLRGRKFSAFSVPEKYRRRADEETASWWRNSKPYDDVIKDSIEDTNLTELTATRVPIPLNVFETATYTPNVTMEPMINLSLPKTNETTTTKSHKYNQADIAVTAIVVAWVILLIINLLALLYKYIQRNQNRRYHNSDWAQQQLKQSRYKTIDQWLVTKTVQPHDWVCDVIQQEEARQRTENKATTRIVLGKDVGSKRDKSTGDVENSVDETHLCRSDYNPSLFKENVHWLCQKLEMTCQSCPNKCPRDEKKQPKKQTPSSTDTSAYNEHQHGKTEGSSRDSDSNDAGEFEKLSCSICLERFRVGDAVSWSPSVQCSHVYHHACIRDWLSRKVACPYCRVTVLPVDRVEEKKGGNMNDTATTTANHATEAQILETSPTSADGTLTTSTPTSPSTPSSLSLTLQSQSKPASSLSTQNSPKLTHDDLAEERSFRIQTTYFWIECGLVIRDKN